MAVPAAILPSLLSQDGLSSRSADGYAALAAAEAGEQQYRNLLDSYTDYWQYHGCEPANLLASSLEVTACGSDEYENLPPSSESDPALTGWDALSASHPPEAFTYAVDTSGLESTSGGGTVRLIVTGRAGNGQARAYRTIEISLQLSGILHDAYYTNYEQPPPSDVAGYNNQSDGVWECAEINDNGAGSVTTTGTWSLDPGDDQQTCSLDPTGTTYQYQRTPGETGYDAEAIDEVPVEGTMEPLTQALCQYHQYQPNTYVDSLGYALYPPSGYPDAGTAVTYSASNPWYGPWMSDFVDPDNPQYLFQPPCTTWNFISGENFSGPVYSNDELSICGSPSFSAGLITGMPDPTYLGTSWPSTDSDGDALGYMLTPGCSSTAPSVSFGPSQSLPSVTTSFASDASSSSSSLGCLYTGPTMIYFQTNTTTNTTTMWVWSPLSRATGNAACGGDLNSLEDSNGTINETFAQASIPPDGVIYVQDVPTETGNANYVSASALASLQMPSDSSMDDMFGSWTCLDPATADEPASLLTAPTTDVEEPDYCQAEFGDLFVSGAVGEPVTVAAQNNVYVTRSTGIACALDDSGTLSETDPSSIPACTSGTGSDEVLGIASGENIWLSHNVPPSTLATSEDSTASAWGSQAGLACTDPADAVPSSASAVFQYVAPDCDLSDDTTPSGSTGNTENPVIDAATAALNGAVGIENQDEGDVSGGGLYLNGTDVGEFRGPFAEDGQSGYDKEISYDTRFEWLTPPDFIQATEAVWTVTELTDCGSSGSAAPPTSCS